MANDCLFTKLKGSVQGNLPKFGEVKFEVLSTPAGNSGFKIANNGSPQELEILTDGVTFENGQRTFTCPLHTSPVTVKVTGPCIIAVKNKYNLTYIYQDNDGDTMALNIGDFKYSPVTTFVFNISNGNSITGDLKDLPPTILVFRIKTGNITGNFEDFPANMMQIVLIATRGISGSINNYTSDKITTLNLDSNDNILGCLECVCQNSINAGRTSGNLGFTANRNSKVVNTLIGNGGERYVTFNNSGCVIGTTSGASNVATCVKSGTAGSYTFTWTDGNGNTYVPEW